MYRRHLAWRECRGNRQERDSIMADFDINARPLDVKEDNKFVKTFKKIINSKWFEWVEIGFLILIYLLPVILMIYVMGYFFAR